MNAFLCGKKGDVSRYPLGGPPGILAVPKGKSHISDQAVAWAPLNSQTSRPLLWPE